MVHEQSSCTHTSFAHVVARFQLALASDGILKSQVTNHFIYRHNGGRSRCVSLVLQCHIWLEYFVFGGQGMYHLLTGCCI